MSPTEGHHVNCQYILLRDSLSAVHLEGYASDRERIGKEWDSLKRLRFVGERLGIFV